MSEQPKDTDKQPPDPPPTPSMNELKRQLELTRSRRLLMEYLRLQMAANPPKEIKQ